MQATPENSAKANSHYGMRGDTARKSFQRQTAYPLDLQDTLGHRQYALGDAHPTGSRLRTHPRGAVLTDAMVPWSQRLSNPIAPMVA
jgi:hypothetical protein